MEYGAAKQKIEKLIRVGSGESIGRLYILIDLPGGGVAWADFHPILASQRTPR